MLLYLDALRNKKKIEISSRQALLEVVQSGGKNLEVAVMRTGSKLEMMEVMPTQFVREKWLH